MAKTEGVTISTNYTYKGNTYRVISFAKMKHPETREWLDAVAYIPVKQPHTLCIRPITEFEEKFKPFVEELPDGSTTSKM